MTNPARGVKAIAKALEDGPLLRAEIGERVGAKAAALTHLLLAASLDVLVCANVRLDISTIKQSLFASLIKLLPFTITVLLF